ncbi:hypothetical protein F4861DRAFT_513660 [Xylaria intraflava]|nr:hypothetical protein F4861DRAFT_513660 [Xylaria intraflava]
MRNDAPNMIIPSRGTASCCVYRAAIYTASCVRGVPDRLSASIFVGAASRSSDTNAPSNEPMSYTGFGSRCLENSVEKRLHIPFPVNTARSSSLRALCDVCRLRITAASKASLELLKMAESYSKHALICKGTLAFDLAPRISKRTPRSLNDDAT